VTAPDGDRGPRGRGEPGGEHVALDRRAPDAAADRPGAGATNAGGDETAARLDAPADRGRRRPRRVVVSVLAAVAVVSLAGLAATGAVGGREDKAAAPIGRPATVKVQRTTLTDSETVDGKLGYGDASSVVSSSGPGAGGGLVTWVPEVGDVIERGDNVYSVNQRKTPLMYGRIPIYRTLKAGDSGTDVKILEQNLKALGYGGFTADSSYTSATATAVAEWQDDLNREQTGTVKPGDVVVAAGPRKVADVKAQVGAPPAGTVLTWTANERVVTVDLDAQYEDLVEVGTKATVELPDGSTAEATVTNIGTPTTTPAGGSQDEDDKATVPIELKVKDQRKIGDYQAASVDVIVRSKARENVLAVPINALVARNGGGYALKLVKPSAPNGVEYVPVKLGMFSDSMVEVSGAGITEGTAVEAPK
jgi:hypothetical protein